MQVILIISASLSNLRLAINLTPLAVMLVVIAEAVQHIVEYKLGMYASKESFFLYQDNPVRLAFGFTKAASVIAATYCIAKSLTNHFGSAPDTTSFNKRFFRNMWDLRQQVAGIIALLIMCGPLIAIHYGLSYLSMGLEIAPILLALDSVVVGLIALIIGTTMWASDSAGRNVSR